MHTPAPDVQVRAHEHIDHNRATGQPVPSYECELTRLVQPGACACTRYIPVHRHPTCECTRTDTLATTGPLGQPGLTFEHKLVRLGATGRVRVHVACTHPTRCASAHTMGGLCQRTLVKWANARPDLGDAATEHTGRLSTPRHHDTSAPRAHPRVGFIIVDGTLTRDHGNSG